MLLGLLVARFGGRKRVGTLPRKSRGRLRLAVKAEKDEAAEASQLKSGKHEKAEVIDSWVSKRQVRPTDKNHVHKPKLEVRR